MNMMFNGVIWLILVFFSVTTGNTRLLYQMLLEDKVNVD